MYVCTGFDLGDWVNCVAPTRTHSQARSVFRIREQNAKTTDQKASSFCICAPGRIRCLQHQYRFLIFCFALLTTYLATFSNPVTTIKIKTQQKAEF
jgi:hypothetical protein